MIHDDQTIGNACHIVHAMGDQHNGGTGGVAVIFNIFKQTLTCLGIKSRGRLVQHQHTGAHRNHTRNGNAALLSAGQLQRRLIEQILANANKPCRFADTLVHLLSLQLLIFGTEGDISIDRLFKQLIFRILEHQTNLEAHVAGGNFSGKNILSFIVHSATGGLQKPVQMLDEGRFPRACMTDQPHKLPLRDFNVNVVDSGIFKRSAHTVSVGQSFNFQNGCHILSFPHVKACRRVFSNQNSD